MTPLRLVLYDRTCTLRSGRAPLTWSWVAGSWWYAGLGRVDASFGAASWAEGLDWLGRVGGERPIGEVQFWGHGRWGVAQVDQDRFDEASLRRGHAAAGAVDRLASRLGPDGLVWWRTCETFGARRGQAFAAAAADRLGCRVAGFTFVIGPLQSGLHSLRPGERPGWDPAEGLREGTPDQPRRAFGSTLAAPNTITCLRGDVPPGW